MSIAYLSERTTALALAAPLLLSLSLGGCVTASGGSSLMDAHAEAPAPAKPSPYLPVEDLPPPRDQSAMSRDEQVKLKKELLAARDRQAAAAKSQGDIPAAQYAKPQ
jgi:hypothetical protein